MNKKRVLIIGGVAGGATLAARLRRLDETAQITIFERGSHISYANCGLPYYVGDIIKTRKALLLQTPERFRDRFNIDVRVHHEVRAIHRRKKSITVKNLQTGEEYEEAYDYLVIATGSTPIRPPIRGVDLPQVKTIWSVEDADALKDFAAKGEIKRAIVVGGGYVGMEMAENLYAAGAEVSVLEKTGQIMGQFDPEIAQILQKKLREKGIKLYLNTGAASFELLADGSVEAHLDNGEKLNADIVILATGIVPNGKLGRDAELLVNERGGIVTDAQMYTSDKSILAVGDVIQTAGFPEGAPCMVPLAGPANKQGRIAANVIAGRKDLYDGTQGSSIVKVFELTAACTGKNEKYLQEKGLKKDRDYFSATIWQRAHAGYYPGAAPMIIKLLFSKDGKEIFGAQIVGEDGVDKRIDVLSTVMRLKGSVHDLTRLELAYAPPYSSAKDPVNMAGYAAENIIHGILRFADWDIDVENDTTIALDVREEKERDAYALNQSVHIPFGQIRARLDELDRNKEIIVFCAAGIRAHSVSRILQNNGFGRVKVYPGGMYFYRAVREQ